MIVRVSIIVPIHDSEKTLSACLSAIHELSPPPHEVIIVDYSSVDESTQIAKASGFTYLRNPTNRGRTHSKNLGMMRSTGDILFFVDSDVVLKSDALVAIDAAFENPSLTGLCGIPDTTSIFPNIPSTFKAKYMNFILSRCVGKVTFSYGSAQAFRREHLTPTERLELFGKGFVSNICDDTELGLRLTESGRQIVLSPYLRYRHDRFYSWFSLLANDFKVPFAFALLASRKGRWLSGIQKGRFAHTSLAQVGSGVCAFLFFIGILGTRYSNFMILPTLGLLTVCLALQASFVKKILTGENLARLPLILGFNLIDQTVMIMGMLSGFAVSAYRQVFETHAIQASEHRTAP